MAKYNVSKAESKKYGIPRVLVSGSSKSSGSSSGSSKTGKVDFDYDTGRLKELQKKYLSSLTPTADETTTNQALQNLLQSRDLGIQQTSQRPIEAGLIRGEAAAKTRTAQIQSQPLIQKLAQLQEARQNQLAGLQSMLGFENQAQQMAFNVAQAKAQQAQQNWQNQFQQNQFDWQKAQKTKTSGGGGAGYSASNLSGLFNLFNAGSTPKAAQTTASYNYNDPNPWD